MPLIGFICPTERAHVDFDHFERCVKGHNGRPAFPPWLARSIAEKALGDVRHGATDLTATRLLGCPRRTWIDILLPYRADPMGMVAAARGTVLHAAAAQSMDTTRWYTEASDPVRLQLVGRLFKGSYGPEGVKVSAQVDVLAKDLSEIVDYKFPKDWSVRYRNKRGGRASVEHAVQLNIARLLLDQQDWAIKDGYDSSTVRMTIWDHGIGDREGPEALEVTRMDELAILMATPFGEHYTVSDIITAYLDMAERHHAGVAPKKAISQLPLVGQKMMGGQMCTGYCAVAALCAEIDRNYPAPAI